MSEENAIPDSIIPNDLPGSARAIAHLIGVRATVHLCASKWLAQYRQLYVPHARNLHPLHWLVLTVGYEKARLLTDEYPGMQIPLCCRAVLRVVRDRAVQEAYAEGVDAVELQARFGMSRAAVYKAVKELR